MGTVELFNSLYTLSIEMIYIKLFLLTLFLMTCKCGQHRVFKRALLFPRATVLQFNYGLSVPLVLPRRSILFSVVAQANYNLPYNISNFTPMTVAARKESFLDITRRRFYKYIVKYLDSFGLEGEECLLRSVCEVAETPMHIKEEETLLEKIIHFIFTPSLEMSSEISNLTRAGNLKFVDKLLLAEQVGSKEGFCSEEYSNCLFSLIDLFTIKYII